MEKMISSSLAGGNGSCDLCTERPTGLREAAELSSQLRNEHRYRATGAQCGHINPTYDEIGASGSVGNRYGELAG